MRKRESGNPNILPWGRPVSTRGADWKSLVLKTVVKKPKGNAPMPKDMWKPVSVNPGTPPLFSGSGLCPWGLGGVLNLGSCWLLSPLPYIGMTFSRLMPALHTGHSWRSGRVSNHRSNSWSKYKPAAGPFCNQCLSYLLASMPGNLQ